MNTTPNPKLQLLKIILSTIDDGKKSFHYSKSVLL